MSEQFKAMLSVGGRKNSLGEAGEVVSLVLADKSRLKELYQCMFDGDAWIRMRAADAFEKIGREHPDWLSAYIDRLQSDLSASEQPSIQWHIAQIYKQIEMNETQTQHAIAWMEKILLATDIDWIVAANTMETLASFTRFGRYRKSKLLALMKIQAHHKSNAVVKRSSKIVNEFSRPQLHT